MLFDTLRISHTGRYYEMGSLTGNVILEGMPDGYRLDNSLDICIMNCSVQMSRFLKKLLRSRYDIWKTKIGNISSSKDSWFWKKWNWE